MVARAVTRVWLASLAEAPPIHRSSSQEVLKTVRPSSKVWQRPVASQDGRMPAQDGHMPANDDTEDDPSIQVDKRDDIVPRRPGAASEPTLDESFWSSHHFWKGIIVGAAIVLLVKTVLAVQAPYGVDWFKF